MRHKNAGAGDRFVPLSLIQDLLQHQCRFVGLRQQVDTHFCMKPVTHLPQLNVARIKCLELCVVVAILSEPIGKLL